MTEVYGLGPDDRAILRDLVKWWRRQGPSRRAPTFTDDSLPPGIDAILCRAPSTGIPALSVMGTGTGTGSGEGLVDDVPGSAICPAFTFRKLPPDSELKNLTLVNERVWNFSETAIPANSWVLAVQERGGRWVAVMPGQPTSSGGGGGSDTACSEIAGLRKSDCVLVESNDDAQEMTLQYSTATSKWTSENNYAGAGTLGEAFTYPTEADPLGSGTVDFWVESGRPRMTIGGSELIYCGDGIFSGGPATGHPTDDSLTTTGTGDYLPCSGESFSVTVSCGACPGAETGTGTGTGTAGTGTGTGGGTIFVACRPQAMPETVTMTVLTSDLCCIAAATEIVLTYDVVETMWSSDGTHDCGGQFTITFHLDCPSTGTGIIDWRLGVESSDDPGNIFWSSIDPGSTSFPLSLNFNLINAMASILACAAEGLFSVNVVE